MSNYITYEERMEVENCLFNGKSFGEIAKVLGKDRSTISREVRKHSLIERSGYGHAPPWGRSPQRQSQTHP